MGDILPCLTPNSGGREHSALLKVLDQAFPISTWNPLPAPCGLWVLRPESRLLRPSHYYRVHRDIPLSTFELEDPIVDLHHPLPKF
jgi:hypothetical protein